MRKTLAKERAEKKQEEIATVKYLSEEWQALCQDAINADDEFKKLARDLTMELNSVIEDCPDGETRFLFWRFESGELKETVSGLLEELGDREPFFTTVASYATFTKINTAKMNVETAVMEGKLRFEGDLARMMSHVDALGRFDEVRRKVPTEY